MKTPQFARRLIVQMYMTLLSILGASAILSPHARAQFAGGTGSVGDPYLVETADQLNAVRDHLTSHFLQVASFDASAYINWVPIGTSTQTFNGTYTGGSNTIENLTIDRPGEEYVGLFGYMAGSSWVKQLSLTNVSVVGSNSVGAVGGFSESNSESHEGVTSKHMIALKNPPIHQNVMGRRPTSKIPDKYHWESQQNR